MPKVVRPAGERRGRRCRGQREEPGLLPHAVIRRRRDDSPLLGEEEAPVFGRAESIEVFSRRDDELGRKGNGSDVLVGPVLEAAVVVGLPRVSPLFAD